MGQKNKILLKLDDLPLIEHIAIRLKAQLPRIIINANSITPQLSALDLPIISDSLNGYVGPLAVTLSAMEYFTHSGKTIQPKAILTIAADTPFFPSDLVQKLLDKTSTTSTKPTIIMASSNARLQPTIAIWPLSLQQALHDFLVVEKGRKITHFAERYNLVEVPFANDKSSGDDPFFNINTASDFKKAQEIFKKRTPPLQ